MPDAGRPGGRWWVVAAWGLLHLVLTSLPESALPDPGVELRVDWLVHFGLCGVMGALVAWGSGGTWRFGRLFGAWLAMAAFGALDEWHQPYFGRTAEWMDWTMDVLGGALGLGVGTLLMRTRIGAWLT